MRRFIWIIAIVMGIAVIMAGCGKKDAGAVVKDLSGKMDELSSYRGTGTMTLYTGQQPQAYEVEVWYQDPHYYRIALTNTKKDVTQIVLRNDEGVFVLTPQLNKSFRFQSDWPERQGQAYLYQTIVQAIVADKDRQFVDDEKAYVFDVISNLQNQSLKRQRIWLEKKSYAPIKVEALDEESKVLLEVKFNSFKFDNKFDDGSFEMQRNMTSFGWDSIPAIFDADPGKEPADSPSMRGSFGVIKPTYVPVGVVLKDINDMKFEDEMGVLLRYEGDYNFTLSESRPQDRAVSALNGTIVDMGFTFGAMLGKEKRTLTWMDDGVEFRLSSADLPQDEMVKIAQSTQDQIGK